MSLTLVSLFAGVGGFDLAFQRAGAKVVAAVEIDKPARTVLAKLFPDTALFDDVTKVTADELRAVGFVPERGILTGGFPCQDLSVAGRRDGLAGTRSGLFWHIVRLLAELHPAWFVLENVPGLLSAVCKPECPGGCMQAHGGAMGTVLGALGELGYGVAYRVLDAKYFGVPQQRRRVFIVGHLGTPFGAAAEVLFEPESSVGDSASGSSSGARVAAVPSEGVAAVVSSLTTSMERYDDNQVGGGQLVVSVAGNRTHALTSEGADASEDGTGRGTPIVAYCPDKAVTITAGGAASPGVNPPGRRHEDDFNLVVGDPNDRIVAPLLSAHRGVPSTDEANQPVVTSLHENQRGELVTRDTASLTNRQMGNAVAVPVVEWIANRLVAVDASLLSVEAG